jgi:hypothetical protein
MSAPKEEAVNEPMPLTLESATTIDDTRPDGQLHG